MNQDPAGRGQHRAEHVDQADDGAADADHAAADLIQHPRDRHRGRVDGGRCLHPAHLVDQAGIIGREPGDLGLHAALGQAAAQPLDQPGAEGVEFGDLRDVDEDVGPASGQLFGVGHHLLEHRAQSARSTSPPRTAQVRCPAQSAPMSGRRSRCQLRCLVHAIHEGKSSSTPPHVLSNTLSCRTHCLVEHAPNQPYLVAPSKHTVQKLPDFKMTSSQFPMLVARIERWPIAGSFTISRGAKTEAVTVVAEVSRGGHIGRGECVPYPRYGETPEATLAALKSMQEPVAQGWTGRPCRRRCLPAPPATRWIARCWTSRPRPRPAHLGPARTSRAAGLHHRLHDLAGNAGGDGGGDRQGRAPAVAQDQARRRRRRGADRRGAQGRSRIRTDRRCQRGLDGRTISSDTRRMRRSRRHPGRAAAAGRPGRGAGAHPPAAGRLRRRKRARPHLAGGTARALRCRQHQARQDRRTDRGAGHGGRRAGAGI